MEDGALQFDKCSKEFVALFNQLSKMGSDWSVILSIKDPRMSRTSDGSRSFIDAVEPEKLFQHVFFENTKLQCVKAVVQFGLYTRGPVGHVHGGAIATILDIAMAQCAGYGSLTVNLNIEYKRAVPLNTTTLVEAKIDKIEGRKMFLSAAMKSVDGCQIYSTATSIFVIHKSNASL